MSAIQSLLRVMTLRDAEAIVLEANKVPSLRRRGQVEALAMPALEPQLLAEFAVPLMAGHVGDGAAQVMFTDTDGATYQLTIDKVAAGVKLVARKGKAAAPAAAQPSSSGASAWWATPAVPPALNGAPMLAPVSGPPDPRARALARIAHLLRPSIAQALARRGSDVFASTGQVPRLRVDGRVETLDVGIDDAELAACVHMLGNNEDASVEVDGTRVRINVFEHLGGVGIAARLIRDGVPSLSELALPPEIASVIEHRDGLVLVCGATGSGKSTTLASLIELLDQKRAAHVITLEDPIEYRFRPRRCLIHQREVGTHIPTFAAGLKAALREAPDVILLGELRDRETIAAALTAAATGHLVLATLHAPSAAGAIDRMIDVFPEAQQTQIRWQLAAVLRTVVTQYLLPRRDGGRVVATEIVPVTPAVANIVRRGDLHTLSTAITTGRDAGMVPLERSLAKLLDSSVVSPAAVKRIATDMDLLHSLSAKLR